MKQLIYIKGGTVFDTQEEFLEYLKNYEIDLDRKKSWPDWLFHSLDGKIECFSPDMPNTQFADYTARKIWFEKYFSFLNDEEIILVGRSLGAIFLLKWLSENTFPKKISQLHIVSAAYTNEGIQGEKLNTFLYDVESIGTIHDQCEEVFLYHGKNDDLIPFWQAEHIASKLPKATFEIFETRKHFFPYGAFPELLTNIGVYTR